MGKRRQFILVQPQDLRVGDRVLYLGTGAWNGSVVEILSDPKASREVYVCDAKVVAGPGLDREGTAQRAEKNFERDSVVHVEIHS